jgi:putative ABC transport system permease protein
MTTARTCVLGARMARQLFDYRDPIGQYVAVGKDYYEVVGVLAEQGADTRNGRALAWHDMNQAVIVPLPTLSGRSLAIAPEQPVDEVWVQVRDGSKAVELGALFGRVISGVKPDRGFDIVVPRELLAQRQRTQRTFSVVIGSIAAIALLVGGIGIMNIMLTSVVERTREIGVRRTVGATRRDVAFQFLAEAILMTVSGGMLGILIGGLVSLAITAFAGWSTRISPEAVVLGFVVSLSVGLTFGLYPALKAAALEPVDAMRYE